MDKFTGIMKLSNGRKIWYSMDYWPADTGCNYGKYDNARESINEQWQLADFGYADTECGEFDIDDFKQEIIDHIKWHATH